MPNAHAYWGNNCTTVATRCNGNGNKMICFSGWDSGSSNDTNDNEPYRATQHLSLAGLISGQYSGISSGGGGVPACWKPMFIIQRGGLVRCI